MRAVDATFNALLVPENGASGVCTLPGRYSKLSPPRLLEPLIRSSLFERLDAHVKARSIIWISAPAGAGKSTLVASFLAHAKIPAIWYAVDAGDNDPASFMAFLNKAVRTECNNANSTSAIIQADPAAHFFHQFYARFPAGSTLIFEDVQNLDWNLAGNILECAISAAPPEVSLFLVSRESCPPHLDEEVVGRPVVRIGWRELRLNERESLLVAGKTSGEEIKHCRNWLALTGGWAAGIVMLRGQLFAGNRNVDAPISPDDLDMAFHYFAHEVLALLSKEEQFALFMLSHMPDWSIEEACEVTGERSTAALVERLFKCGTFVDCATPESGDVHCMHFHPMFQMFLEHESKRELPSSVRRALISRVAGVFLRRGQIPEAASRYRDSQDWNALAALLLRDARQMIAEGRGESWRQWQSWLPEQAKDAHPWLFYWEGQYLNLVNARQARVAILRAEAAFAARGDHRASLLSIALMVDNIIPCFSVADRAPLQRWADAMGTRMVALPAGLLSADDQILIQSRLIAALVYSSARDGVALHRAVDTCMQAMTVALDDEARLTTATFLLASAHWFRFDKAESMIALVEPLAEKEGINATIRVWWHFQLARWQFDCRGDPESALGTINRAVGLAGSNELHAVFDFKIKLKRLLLLVSIKNVHEARILIGQMRTAFTPGSKPEEVRFRMIEALFHAAVGELALAVRIAAEAFRDETHIVASERPRFAAVIAGLNALAGDFPRAEAWSARAIDSSTCTDFDISIQFRELLHAYQRLKEGNRKGAAAILRRELKRHRVGSTPAFLPRLPQLASAIAGFALEEGIETAHVSEIIRRQHLLPDDVASADWPWTIAVHALGPVRICKRGVMQEAVAKAPQRPLLLLKALLLAGAAGRQQHALADQLWPDSEDAMTAMNTTVHRLRKLFGSDRAVIVTLGTVTLDPGTVWSDLTAFALVSGRIDALNDGTSLSQLLYLENAVCRLYRGPLCDGDNEGWIISARDRYRNHLVSAATKLGLRLEDMDAWPEANRLYLVARQAEPLAEVIHRGLMRCAYHTEGSAGAAAAYRRCRETLSLVLGSKPSMETVALAQMMALGQDPPNIRSHFPVPGAS